MGQRMEIGEDSGFSMGVLTVMDLISAEHSLQMHTAGCRLNSTRELFILSEAVP